MNINEIVSLFTSYDSVNRSYFLSLLSLYLTIYARDTYTVDTDEVAAPKKLRAYNEIQHRVAGKLSATIIDDVKCYPDDVFIKLLFEIAEHAQCADELKSALNRSFEVVNRRIEIT
jgi:hypothetical protein